MKKLLSLLFIASLFILTAKAEEQSFKFKSNSGKFRFSAKSEWTGKITISPPLPNGETVIDVYTKNVDPKVNDRGVYKNKEYTVTAKFTKLDLSDNSLESLDVSKLTNLKELECNKNQISSLDLSKLTKLEKLNCSQNLLSSLKLANLTNLQDINCSSNRLSNLDLSGLTNLEKLRCNSNQISSLDPSQLKNLAVLICNDNQIPSLDLTKLTKLEKLYCSNNRISSLVFSNPSKLKEILCTNNQLTGLELSKLTQLERLHCNTNLLSFLHLAQLTNLKDINCNSNNISSIELPSSTNLKYLHCSSNQLASLDVSKSTHLEKINCNSNELVSLDVSKLTNLNELNCNSNQIASIELPISTNLKYLHCNSNQIASLEIWKLTHLADLNCSDNELASLDLSKLTKLEKLHCSKNKLSSLKFSNPSNLKEIVCTNNELASLDLSKLTNLEKTYCDSNHISSLDISKLKNLQALDCNTNQISSIELPVSTNLKFLNCSDNQLASLEIWKLKNLANLNCANNQISSLELPNSEKHWRLLCQNNRLIDTGTWTFTHFNGKDQSPIIPMKPDEAGGFISVNKYLSSLGERLTIALPEGVSFKDGRFISNADFLSDEIEFSTIIDRKNSRKLEGKVKFLPTKNTTVPIKVTLKDKDLEDGQFEIGLFKENETRLSASATNDATGNCTIKTEDLTVGEHTYTLKQISSLQQAGYAYDEKKYTVVVTVKLNTENSTNHLETTLIIKDGENEVTTAEFKNTYSTPGSFKFKSKGSKLKFATHNKVVSGAITIYPNLLGSTSNITIKEGDEYEILPETEYTVSGSFTNLDLYNNQLTSLDLSGLQNLKKLRCAKNELETLDASKLASLTFLSCWENEISNLNVSGCTNLEKLNCEKNLLRNLDLSGLVNINSLSCGENQLSSLALSGLTNLENLYCDKNKLEALDISSLTALKRFGCRLNQLLDIKTNTSAPNEFWGTEQSATIAMKPNGEGGLISVNKYSLDLGERLNITLPEGISFKSGYFISTANLPNDEIVFSTTIGWGNTKKLKGKLKFVTQTTSASIPIKVSLEGKALEDGQFKFGLFNENASEAFLSAINDTTGSCKIEIDDLTQGEHIYTLKQISNQQENYTFDEKEYKVVITVKLNAENAENALEATLIIKHSETEFKTAEFKNTFNPPGSFKFKSRGEVFWLAPKDVSVKGDITIYPPVSRTTDRETIEDISIIVVDYVIYNILPNTEYTVTGYFSRINLERNNIYYLDLSNSPDLKALNCSGNPLLSLDLSKLTKLEELDCGVNKKLTSLDLSKLTNLKKLYCKNTGITSLDLSNLTNLQELDCESSELTSLDISNWDKLMYIKCTHNRLIDFSGIPSNFGTFDGINQRPEIAMKPNGESGYISVNKYSLDFWNRLDTSLPEGTSFKDGYFFRTAGLPSEEIEFSTDIGLINSKKLRGKLKFVPAINASVPIIVTLKDKALENDQFKFGLFKGNLTEAFLSTTNDATGSCQIIIEGLSEGKYTYRLKQISDQQVGYTYDKKEYTVVVTIDSNPDKTLKATVEIKDDETIVTTAEFKNTYTPPGSFKFKSKSSLFWLHSDNTSVEGGITIYPAVSHTTGDMTTENINTIVLGNKYIILPDTQYTVSGYFSKIDLWENQLYELELSNSTNLETLYCADNLLENLDLSKLTNLKKLNCNSNQLSSLDLSELTNLETLDCADNSVSSLDLSKLTNLKKLDCGSNQLSSLDLSKLTNLETLSCVDNQLSDLNLSKLTNLKKLDCSSNQLASLNPSNSTNLDTLYCTSNQLSSLNLSNSTNLETLYCGENQLSSLDLSNSAKLQSLHCERNQLIDIKYVSKRINVFLGENQSPTIAMKPNEEGGFISVNEYSVDKGHKLSIATLPEGTRFENGHFVSTAGFPIDEIKFSNTIDLVNKRKLNGKLKFFGAAAIVNGRIKLESATERLKAEQFEFRLYKKDETTIFASARNDAAGNFKFILEPPQEAGTYTYTLKLHNDAQEGYSYDAKEYTVELTAALKTRNAFEYTAVIKDGETIVTTVEFKNTYSPLTSIVKIQTAAQIKVYPNPFKNDLYIEAAERITALSLYDLSGRLLMKEKVDAESFVLPGAELKAGVYILRIQTLNAFENIKLIKE